MFRFIACDIGRPLSDIVTDLIYEDLCTEAKEVLRTLLSSDKEVATRDGNCYKVRIMPYRTQEDRIDGVVITFVEITLAKMPEMKLRKSETELASLIDSAPQIIVSLSADGTILEFNREAERVFGQNREHAIGRNYFELFVPEPAWQEVSDGMFRALSGSPVRGLETPALVCGGSTAQILWSINSILDPDGGVIGVIAMGHPHASP